MPLLVSDIAAALKGSRLGGESSISTVTLCNQAGRHLTSMHEWMWLARPAATLSLVANQGYAKLPPDFGSVIAVQGGTWGSNFGWTTLESIAWLRSGPSTVGGPWGQQGTIVHVPSIVTGKLEARLELFPAPATSNSTTYKLFYRATWKDLDDNAVLLPLPAQGWLDLLFMEVVFAVAQGYEEHDIAGISARLTALRGSDVFRAAVEFDGLRSSQLGQMGGGWYSSGNDVDWSLYPASIGGPGS